ncbi:MAG: CDP-alcohol phosphatidyltransferase family protein [Candidatus Thermoplasmatota archaeon]
MNKETSLTFPDFLTVVNASIGFLSITYILDGMLWLASLLISSCVALDGIDGALARYLGVEHELGAYLDFFSDIISFCFAPALLLYYTYYDQALGRGWESPQNALATIVPFFIVFLGTMRLARFADKHSEDLNYNGLPTPSLALMILHLSYLLGWNPTGPDLPYFTLSIIGLLSILLYTSIEYPKFRVKKTQIFGSIFLILTFTGFLLADLSHQFGITILIFTTSLLLGYVFISPFILKIYGRQKRQDG